jgi:hypothetical protein
MLTTTGMSAPPIGMMISTPSTKPRAQISAKSSALCECQKPKTKNTAASPSARLSLCWPANCTGAPWNRRNLYLPLSLPKAMTEPLKVTAPMKAPSASSMRLPPGMGPPLAVIWKAQGSATAAMAMNTAARPIMLCMKATSSGILVISTRCAIVAPTPPPTTRPSSTQPRPPTAERPALPACAVPASLTISAAVVSTAIVMPTMPNRLPRMLVVGWLRPFKAWMKQTLATRYSSVTRFRLILVLRAA